MQKNLLIWFVAAAFAAVSCSSALGGIAKNKSPDLALSLFPKNGFAYENRATGQVKAFLTKNQGQFPDQEIAVSNRLAIAAFDSEPVSPDAISVIALANTGDVRRELMRKAFALSRRQQLVTGWMITDSGLRDDIPSILRYYDTVLRTSAPAGAALIPVMANALADEKFVEPFASILKDDPPWAGRFWNQVIRTKEAASNAADLRHILYRANEPTRVYQDEYLIKMLLVQGRFIKAERLYYLLSGIETKNKLLRNGEFLQKSRYPPMDWELVSTGEYGAEISQEQLNLSAVRNSGGLFARQLVKLPKSLLELKMVLAEDPPDAARLYLGLSCAQDLLRKPENIRIPVEKETTISVISNDRAECRYYWLDITGRSADNSDGFDISVKSISFESKP